MGKKTLKTFQKKVKGDKMDIFSQLRDFGLTDYEARVYIALLGLKQAKVSAIAKACNVPRNKIYAVAESLHKKGFVEIIPEKVIKFRAVPFEEATQLFLKEQESKLRALEESSKKISSFLSSFHIEKKEDSTGEFLVYKSKKMIYKKLREIVSQAKTKLFLFASQEDLAYVRPIVKSISKKVDVNVLCEVTESNLEAIKKWLYFSNLRHYEKTLPERIAIIDDAEAFVFQTNSPVALYSKDPQFVALMKSFGSMIWEHSASVEEEIVAIETGVPLQDFRIVHGTEYVYSLARKSSATATKELMKILTETELQSNMKHGVIDVEKQCAEKGVKLRYILPITRKNISEVRQLMNYAEVRHMEFIPLQLKIVDSNYCSVWQSEEIGSERVNIVSTSHSFVEAMKTYFEKIWRDVMPAEKRMARLLMVEHVKKEAAKQGLPLSQFISPGKLSPELEAAKEVAQAKIIFPEEPDMQK